MMEYPVAERGCRVEKGILLGRDCKELTKGCQAQIRSIIATYILIYNPYHVLSSYKKSTAITALQNICRTILSKNLA
jgi:hypothetical protein